MMKAQKDAEEITRILAEAPSARKALLDNYDNLSNVAKYCEDNYFQFQAGSDSSKALEETKAFTTQSLASVAYQISSLATNVLRLLEAQTSQLRRIESSVHLIGLTVDMHREKVARREIGVFTMTKRCSRSNKVIPPPGGKEPKPKYTRNPISYSSLDSLGHSMKDAKPQERKATMMRKQGGTLGRNSRPAEPVQCPVAPSLSRGASQTSLSDKMTTSSFGKAVSPPVVPNWPTSPDTDIVSTLLENGSPAPPLLGNGPPAPAMLDEVGPEPKLNIPPAPPPHFAPCDLLPPPPMPPAEENFEASDLGSIAPPPPAPLLETVPEENSLPLPECLPPPIIDVLQIPTPPPHFAEEHGDDLEIPALSPPPFMDCLDGFEDLPPLPPPVDYDTSTPAEYLEEVVALYSYDTGKPGDLAFQVGDVIYLTRRNEDGWCEGVLNGLAGFFPGNYVERTS
ncbi:ABI family, member 3a isoform X2 [Electrophorus electricus]|uniref:ABI family, member 3a isoform X2 n=1 Tax=Electrophorus electricus TaxID=8005 RepID=UPI0015D08A38|nr:ABI family, member 3a isoform X2 [Electrophorus electricus]